MKNLKTIFGVIVLILVIYIMNSTKALSFTLEISAYVWAVTLVLSLIVFLPLSFINRAKNWCYHWFTGVALLQFIRVFLTIKYLLYDSGEMDKLDAQRWPAPIMILISLYRSIIGAGYDVYWPLLMTLVWGFGFMYYAERLNNQYINYEYRLKNKLNN